MLQRLALTAVLFAFILAGCKDKDSVVSPPQENSNLKSVINEKGQVDPEFKKYLETEIKKEDNSISKTWPGLEWFIHDIHGPTVITTPVVARFPTAATVVFSGFNRIFIAKGIL